MLPHPFYRKSYVSQLPGVLRQTCPPDSAERPSAPDGSFFLPSSSLSLSLSDIPISKTASLQVLNIQVPNSALVRKGSKRSGGLVRVHAVFAGATRKEKKLCLPDGRKGEGRRNTTPLPLVSITIITAVPTVSSLLLQQMHRQRERGGCTKIKTNYLVLNLAN